MASVTMRRVKDLKEALTKHQENKDGKNESSNEQILDIISHLDKCSINLTILAETLIGATVSKFKASSNADVALKAKTLVKKWKQLAKQSGVKSSSSSSAKPKSATVSSSSSKPVKPSATKSSSATTATKAATKAATKPITAWDHLSNNMRKSSAAKLHEAFLQSTQSLLKQQPDETIDSISSKMISKATDVEAAISAFSKNIRTKYIDKIRSLIFNLKKNEPLRNNVILGHTSPSTLVNMSTKELQTADKAKERSDQIASLQGSRRLDWEQKNAAKVNEMCGIKGKLLQASLFTCGRCGSIKTTSTQKQTRSADEPMTVFVFCENCGNRWKC